MIKGQDYIGVATVFFCHDGKGNLLMAKRSKNCRDEHDRWDIGAGGLEFGDEIENRLRTEIKEEYCAEILSYEFLGFRNVINRKHKGRPTHWVTLDFKVLIDPAQVNNGEPYKFDEVKWFTLNNLPAENELHSQLPYFLEKYKIRL